MLRYYARIFRLEMPLNLFRGVTMEREPVERWLSRVEAESPVSTLDKERGRSASLIILSPMYEFDDSFLDEAKNRGNDATVLRVVL